MAERNQFGGPSSSPRVRHFSVEYSPRAALACSKADAEFKQARVVHARHITWFDRFTMQENIAERLLRETNDFADAHPLVEVEGMSSAKVCNLLNGLVAHLPLGECYLEIGTWRGLTLLSAAYRNRDKVCIACDKFRFWGRWTGW